MFTQLPLEERRVVLDSPQLITVKAIMYETSETVSRGCQREAQMDGPNISFERKHGFNYEQKVLTGHVKHLYFHRVTYNSKKKK